MGLLLPSAGEKKKNSAWVITGEKRHGWGIFLTLMSGEKFVTLLQKELVLKQ